MTDEFDLFEKFPNGSSFWRGSFRSFVAANVQSIKLAEKSSKQFYAVSLATGEVVALTPGRSAILLLAPLKVQMRSKRQAA